MRVAILSLLIAGVPCVALAQFTERERIAALESDMRNVRNALERIEDKLDDVDDKLDDVGDAPADAKEGSILGSVLNDRLLEILLIVIVGGDKAAYWRKRRNGTWTKGSGDKTQH